MRGASNSGGQDSLAGIDLQGCGAVMTDDLSDRLEIVVDPDADPVDFDEALAVFLLDYAGEADESADRRPGWLG